MPLTINRKGKRYQADPTSVVWKLPRSLRENALYRSAKLPKNTLNSTALRGTFDALPIGARVRNIYPQQTRSGLPGKRRSARPGITESESALEGQPAGD